MHVIINFEDGDMNETVELDDHIPLVSLKRMIVGIEPRMPFVRMHYKGVELPTDGEAGLVELGHAVEEGGTITFCIRPPSPRTILQTGLTRVDRVATEPARTDSDGRPLLSSDEIVALLTRPAGNGASTSRNAASLPVGPETPATRTGFDSEHGFAFDMNSMNDLIETGLPVSLTDQESARFSQLFDDLKTNAALKANFDQRMPTALGFVERGDRPGFLELLRKLKESHIEQKRMMKIMLTKPGSKEAQQYKQKLEKDNDIRDNFKTAMEHTPEVFGQVFMLYINCRLNGCDVQAFVDTGAQVSVMTRSLAEEIGLERILDERFNGTAVGVGTTQIVGKVHCSQLEIAGNFFPHSFSVLQDVKKELILGLDFLKRYRVMLDMRNNNFCLPDFHATVRFLDEHELPESAQAKLESNACVDA